MAMHEEFKGNTEAREQQEVKVEMISMKSLKIIYHPRKNFKDLESLQQSIRRDGLQEPLMVYPIKEGKYAIIDGCRRFKAIEEFGWKSVTCVIRMVDTVEAAHISYTLNVERTGFDPIKIALHLKSMKDEFGFSHRDLEMKGYGSPAQISQKPKLLELPSQVQAKIQSRELGTGHGLALTKLATPKEQERWGLRIIDHEISVKRAETMIGTYIRKSRKVGSTPKKPIPDTDIPGVYFKDARDMSELPDKSVHLIMTSPPYLIGVSNEKGIYLR